MKLFVSRNQEDVKGFFGGSKGINFSLSCRLELAPDESALVEKYKQWDLTVYSYELAKGGTTRWSLRDMIQGSTVSCDGVGALLDGEDSIKTACANIKVMLDVMASFGGQEVIEF